jgi:hypothetical protein
MRTHYRSTNNDLAAMLFCKIFEFRFDGIMHDTNHVKPSLFFSDNALPEYLRSLALFRVILVLDPPFSEYLIST